MPPYPLHCIPVLIFKTFSVFGGRVSRRFLGKWDGGPGWQGRERRKGGEFIVCLGHALGGTFSKIQIWIEVRFLLSFLLT